MTRPMQRLALLCPSGVPAYVLDWAVHLTFLLGLALILVGCQVPPRNAADVDRAAGLAYGLAVEVLVTADAATAAYLDALEAPSEVELARAGVVVEGLVLARQALVEARRCLVEGREVLGRVREAVAALQAAAAALDDLGVTLPGPVLEGLSAAAEAVQ